MIKITEIQSSSLGQMVKFEFMSQFLGEQKEIKGKTGDYFHVEAVG